MSDGDLLDAFLRAHRATAGIPTVALRSALDSLVAKARLAWPDIAVDGDAFAAYVGERLLATGDILEQLASVNAEGLYLACACVARDPHAIVRFVETVGPEVERALAQVGVQSAQREDLLSKLQQLFFFGDGSGAPPILGTYTGRGSLRSWARSVGVKHALTIRQKDQRLVPLDDAMFELPANQTSPELAYLRELYLDEFRAALARATLALSKRERNLLRQHYLDGMTLEAVARVHRVHRATAARWLAEARENVLRRTKEELSGAVHLSGTELESLLAFVQRQSSFGDGLSRIRDVFGGK